MPSRFRCAGYVGAAFFVGVFVVVLLTPSWKMIHRRALLLLLVTLLLLLWFIARQLGWLAVVYCSSGLPRTGVK